VNVSLEKSAQSLSAFSDRFPFYPADNDMDRKVAAAEDLRAVLDGIYSTR
jgi:hypothetical protein